MITFTGIAVDQVMAGSVGSAGLRTTIVNVAAHLLSGIRNNLFKSLFAIAGVVVDAVHTETVGTAGVTFAVIDVAASAQGREVTRPQTFHLKCRRVGVSYSMTLMTCVCGCRSQRMVLPDKVCIRCLFQIGT